MPEGLGHPAPPDQQYDHDREHELGQGRSPALPEPLDVTALLAPTDQAAALVHELALVVAAQQAATRALVASVHRLEALVSTDALTGLPNRRGFDEALVRAEAQAARDSRPVVVLLFDLSGLGTVNNRYGHLAGDMLLRAMASALRTATRGADIVARWGGDEFAALLPGTDEAGAEAFLARLEGVTAAATVALPDGTPVSLRWLVGLATRAEAGSLAAALATADQRLVRRKQAARPPAADTR